MRWLSEITCIASRSIHEGWAGISTSRTSDRWIGLFKECYPLPLREIEYVKIIQFLCDFIDPSKDNHVLPIENVAWVSTPFKWIDSIGRFDFLPSASSDVESPNVIQLVIVVISTSKYPHSALMNDTWVTTSWFRLWLACREIDLSPSVILEEVLYHLIRPLSLQESSKDDHWPFILIYYCRMLISWQWEDLISRFRLDNFPPKRINVKCVELLVLCF